MAKARKAASKAKKTKRGTKAKTKSKAKTKKSPVRKTRRKTQTRGFGDMIAETLQVMAKATEDTAKMRRRTRYRGIDEG